MRAVLVTCLCLAAGLAGLIAQALPANRIGAVDLDLTSFVAFSKTYRPR